MLNLAAIQSAQAAIGLGGQIGLEQAVAPGPIGRPGPVWAGAPPKPNWDSMLGPMSKGLNMVSGLFDAANLFSASKTQKASARQFRQMAAQALEQGFQTSCAIPAEGAEQIGEMTAAFGKSGTLLEGSPLLALADEQNTIEMSMARAIEQGRIQYQAYRWQARQAEKAAKGGIMGGIAKIAGVVAAPFTGGASLGLTAAQWGS